MSNSYFSTRSIKILAKDAAGGIISHEAVKAIKEYLEEHTKEIIEQAKLYTNIRKAKIIKKKDIDFSIKTITKK